MSVRPSGRIGYSLTGTFAMGRDYGPTFASGRRYAGTLARTGRNQEAGHF
jgi:hypothetical protein